MDELENCCAKCFSEFEHDCKKQQYKETGVVTQPEEKKKSKESLAALSSTSIINKPPNKPLKKGIFKLLVLKLLKIINFLISAIKYDKCYEFCKIKSPHDYICTELCINNVESSEPDTTIVNTSSQYITTATEDLDSTYEKCFVKRIHSFVCCKECVNKKDSDLKSKKRVRSVNFRTSSIFLGPPEDEYQNDRFRVLDGVHRSTRKTVEGATFNGEQVIDMIFHNDDFRSSGIMASVDKEFDDYGHQIGSRRGTGKAKRRKRYVYNKT